MLEPRFALVGVTVVLNLVIINLDFLFQDYFGYGSLFKKK